MASKSKKPPSDIVTLTERNENLNQTVRHQNINIDRVAQLEQNMKFLQDQHQATLVALHKEVESLHQKNRDLQFQLVFSKGSTCTASRPSSPEDNDTEFVKSKVELLEKSLEVTQMSLQMNKHQNQYLSEIIEQQKQKLQSIEKQTANKQSMIDVGIQVENKGDSVLKDVVSRLEVAEMMVQLLRQCNKEQRNKIIMLTAAFASTSGNNGARSRDSTNNHRSRGSPMSTSREQMPHEVPSLRSQSFWHRSALRSARNGQDVQDHESEVYSTALPQLQNGNMKSDTMTFKFPFYRSQGCRNYYRDESIRIYRAQSPQRDRRDNDNYHHRRQFKDRSSKVHQKELVDSTEGSTEADNSTGSKS